MAKRARTEGDQPSTLAFSLCTYNVWKTAGEPTAWDVRRPVLLRQLKQLDPDVLLVQELCPEIAECILEALPGHACVKNDDFKGWTHEGNIFFRKAMFAEAGHGCEPIEQEEPLRRLFWVRLLSLAAPESVSQPHNVLFATAHLTWQGHAAELQTDTNLRKVQGRQAAAALERLQKPSEPAFFGGDLNESFWPTKILRGAGFADCFSPLGLPVRPTHPNRSSLAHEECNADAALDWLFARGARGEGGARVRPLLAAVVTGSCGLSSDDPDEKRVLSVVPSDHCPVVAVYRVEW